ncbi:MAG: hypothetical protein GY696_19575 [Gammaproteobacteria bacterium]|nr:hypothetical protein [Gammaproteobacteria bacterium]
MALSVRAQFPTAAGNPAIYQNPCPADHGGVQKHDSPSDVSTTRTGQDYFEVSQDGQLLEDQGRQRCPEEGHGPKGHPAPPAHLLEHLVANNGQVGSGDGRLQLPCLARENGCQTLHRTYVWHADTGSYQLK